MGDLGHGEVGFRKQVFALLDPSGDQVIDGGNAVFLFEGMGQIVFVHVSLFR